MQSKKMEFDVDESNQAKTKELCEKLFKRFLDDGDQVRNNIDERMTNCQAENDNLVMLSEFCWEGVAMCEVDIWLENTDFNGYVISDYTPKELESLLQYEGNFYKDFINSAIIGANLENTIDLNDVFGKVLNSAFQWVIYHQNREQNQLQPGLAKNDEPEK